MHGLIAQFLAGTGETIAAALILAVANSVRRMSRSVRETATVTTGLVTKVDTLESQVAELRNQAAWPQSRWNGTR